MTEQCAREQARRSSEEGYVQHVNRNTDDSYSVSDWCDNSTVASYENGREL